MAEPRAGTSRGPSTARTPTAKGHLILVPKPPEGGAVPDDLRIDIELVGSRLHPHPLPVPHEDGTQRYQDLPVGTYRLRLFSDTTVDSVVEAKVTAGGTERVEVPLVAGGHAQVKVTLYNGEAPPEVTLALKDARGATVAARYQGRSPTKTTSPRVGASVTVPPESVVSGLRPGRYTLRATSPAGEFEEQTFDVGAGQGVVVDMKVRR
jgi:hypothetical protein